MASAVRGYTPGQPIVASASHPVIKLSLSQWTKREDVRSLDREAQAKGFRPETVMQAYQKALDSSDVQLTTALEKRDQAKFVEMKTDVASGKKSYYLSLMELGEGANRNIFLAITNRQGAPLVASVPKKANSNRSREVKYLRAMEGCPNIIQLKGYAHGQCYFERAKGDFETLLEKANNHPQKKIDNAPQLIRGVLRGGVQMAEKRIMHLDLKFDNILIGMDGEVKIADWEQASFVDEEGIAIEKITGRNCVMGNLLHASPERYRYSLDKCNSALEHAKARDAKAYEYVQAHGYSDMNCLPEEFQLQLDEYLATECPPPADGNLADYRVGLQDNVWGEALLISRLAKKSTTRQLSDPFQGRYMAYIKLYNNAYKKGLEADAQEKELKSGKKEVGREWTLPFLKTFYEHMFEGLKKCPDDNLFGSLLVVTPLDDLVKRMTSVDPEKRITIQEAEKLFKIAVYNPTGYFEEVERLYSPAQSSANLSSSPGSSSDSCDSLAHSHSDGSSSL